MSAFFVLEGVIDDVVCLLMPSAMDGDEMANQLGRKLWLMNAEAVQQRYGFDPDGVGAGELATMRAAIDSYTYVEPKSVDEMQRYKSLRCFTYQCCEGNVPEQDLYKRCDKLEDQLDDIYRSAENAYAKAKSDRPRNVEDMLRAFPDKKRRRNKVEGCAYCEEHGDGMMPPHDASPNCQSGGHSHCTCDTCF